MAAYAVPSVFASLLILLAVIDAAFAAGSDDPILLKIARGDVNANVKNVTPVWMMRQAGRHMQVYRDVCKSHATFRERSETPDVATEVSLQPWRRYRVDGVILFSDILTPLPAMGIDFSVGEGTNSGSIKLDQTIGSLDDLLRMERHPFEPEKSLSFVAEALQGIHKCLDAECAEHNTDRPTVLGFVGCPFTLATYLIEGTTGTQTNFEATSRSMDYQPELLHGILQMLVDRMVRYVQYQVEDGGAQIIQLFDSWAGWLTRTEFECWAWPYQRQLVLRIKDMFPDLPLILYMAPLSMSRNGAYLELLAATGVDIVSIDHTVNIVVARKRLDAAGYFRTGIQGNLDPSILLVGPKSKIEEETQDMMRELQKYCDTSKYAAKHNHFYRHIMNLGHGIDKNTPEEHAEHFVQTVQNFSM